jgi:hypothetical protein
MPAMQLQTYTGTAINTTLAPLAAASGDSLSVSNFAIGKSAWLVQLWADVQAAGTLRVRSPKFHDNVNGIRIDTIASDPQPLMPWGMMQPLYPNDTLIVELAGSATAGDIESVVLLEYFDEMPGVQSRLQTWDQVRGRVDQFLTVENTIATGTGGGYTGAEAINAEIDQFQQGVDYAILGYKVDVEAAAIGWRAVDFGNLRVGGPGEEVHLQFYADWFIRLSNAYGKPMIPIFNGSNKSSVLVDAVQDENGTDTTVTTYLARLRPGG